MNPVPRIVLAVALVVASAALHAGTLEDMAAFERVFIPALALTNQPKAPAERVASSLQRLSDAWPGLRERFGGRDARLEQAVRTTDRALADASRLLAEGRRAEAHGALEAIRPAFLEARRAAGIELYVDRLTQFHDVMEEVVKRVEAGQPAQSPLGEASALWTRAERPGFDPALFGFDEAKYAELRKRVQDEREVIEALDEALVRGDAARSRELAAQLKSRFSQIYAMFGDFGQ
jgi:hypothetical protein